VYKSIVRPLLFSCDSEKIHDFALRQLAVASRVPPLCKFIERRFAVSSERLETKCFGLTFSNPIGLAAGFDKNAVALPVLGGLGFGHIEVGSVTGIAQDGNPKPRIFRLPKDEALINRMGFPSQGADAVAERLSVLESRCPAVLGINLGKTKVVPLESALDDYLSSFRKLQKYADYVVLNVSSPNTPELRKLQEPDRLKQLFAGVQAENTDRLPLLVKIAPDLELSELDSVLEVAEAVGAQGIIATNTTSSRDGLVTSIDEQGGLSGRPLHKRSLNMVRHCYQRVGERLVIVGVGGISTADDVLAMIRAGASMVQLYTGFIYEGPLVASRLARQLDQYCIKEGVASLQSLVGDPDR
jgi:dihydroorotate dehydrogenase